MPDEIRPALTPEEWKAAKNTVYLRDVLRDCADSAMSFEGDDSLVKAMAVANAALPDDNPRKITREDVNALDAAIGGRAQFQCERCGARYDEGDGYFGADNACPYCGHCHAEPRRSQDLQTLRSKLAALLPPE